MSTFLVAGYKNVELGIFNDKDKRIEVIKALVKKDLIRILEGGCEWLIFTGNLGFEFWVLEVAKELQVEYQFSIATIFMFETHGENWNDVNQEKLNAFRTVDYTKYAFESYQHPGQFKQFNQFLINHTDGIYIFYDSERATNLKFLYEEVRMLENYDIILLTFERLDEFYVTYESED